MQVDTFAPFFCLARISLVALFFSSFSFPLSIGFALVCSRINRSPIYQGHTEIFSHSLGYIVEELRSRKKKKKRKNQWADVSSLSLLNNSQFQYFCLPFLHINVYTYVYASECIMKMCSRKNSSRLGKAWRHDTHPRRLSYHPPTITHTPCRDGVL